VLEESLFDRVLIEPCDGAQPAGNGGAGPPLASSSWRSFRCNVEIGQYLGSVALMHDRGFGPIMSKRFSYAIDKRYLPLLVPFGLRGSKDGVTLTDEGSLSATFGFFKIKTPLANVTEAHITRNYRWWTAFGVRGSMVDDGLSFGTNHNAGVCIHFAEKVPSPLRRSGHSALTVTVADLEGLTSALAAGHGEASSASPP
jgi:hypothetical protein